VIRLGYKARLKGIIQFSAGTIDLSLLHNIQTGSGAHSAFYSIVPRAPSPGTQQVELRMSRAVPPFSYMPLWCVFKQLYLYHMIPLQTFASDLKMDH
jgi:hypothetical protein